MKNPFSTTAAVCAILLLVRIVSSSVTAVDTELPASLESFAWSIVADLLAAIAITTIAQRSTLRGWQLGTAVTAFYFGTHGVNAIEAVAYLDITWSLPAQVLICGLVTIPAWKLIFAPAPACASGFPWAQRSPASWVIRL